MIASRERPWRPHSRHPDNRLDNLVAAHRSCNSARRDFLAGAGHLRRWRERSDDHGDRLQVIAGQASWPQDRERTLGAVRGIYLRLPEGVALWRGGREFEEARHGELAAALGMG